MTWSMDHRHPARETVPDTFFDSADETVMVDMSADELLARLKAGRSRRRTWTRAPRANLLPQGQPAGAARDRAAPRGRRGRERGEALPRPTKRDQAASGRPRAVALLHRPATRRRARGAQRRAPRQPARREVDRGLRRDAGAGRSSSNRCVLPATPSASTALRAQHRLLPPLYPAHAPGGSPPRACCR